MKKVIDTDPYDIDTDDDGLPDGYEVLTLNTDPLELDTDENGISDADEDFDNDNLNNLGEYLNKTGPFNPDTDEDGLLDGDEIKTYGTDPLNPDTDNDKLLDGEEGYDGTIYKKYGVYFDPLNPDTNGNGILDGDEVYTQSKNQSVETYDKAITEIKVDMDTNGSLERNLTIESMYGIDAMSSDVYAMIGEPFNFTSETSFESATITFAHSSSSELNRIIILTNGNTQFTFELDDYDLNNVNVYIVDMGGYTIGESLKNLVNEAHGCLYSAVSASDLTYQVGETITTPPQFIGDDSDGDSIPDIVEDYGLKPNGQPIGTNKLLKDTDGDGLDDNVELRFSIDTFNNISFVDTIQIGSHYMNITGVLEFSDDVCDLVGFKTMLEVATYGKKYYINYDEYKNYIDLVTNIMYIKK